MKKSLVAMLLTLCFSPLAWAQTRLITEAKVPDRETRRRMGLDLLWHIRLPMTDPLDGLFSVQVMPWRTDPQILVQTRSGKVFLLDGETGDIIWRAQPPGTVLGGMLPAAFNSHSIYIVRGEWLDILNRANGKMELYTWNKTTKVKKYGMRLKVDQLPPKLMPNPPPVPLSPPITTPVADEDNFIYTSGSKIICFAVPNYQIPQKPPPPPEKGQKPPPDDGMRNPYQPDFMWMMMLGASTSQQFPIVTGSQVAVLEKNGIFLSMEKYEDKTRYRFKAEGRILAAGAQFNEIAYFGSEGQKVYALDVENGTVLWQPYVTAGPILRKPNCNDRDVFVKADGDKFYRLDRETGQGIWGNRDGNSFLAANRMFVYTRDTEGKLLIHDYVRGTVLARYDMQAWQVSIPNEWTDRIYLGNHDGQILCMNHHDYPQAQKMKSQNWFIKRIFPKKEKGKKG